MSEKNETFLQTINRWFRTSISVKVVTIIILTLLLLIPTKMIEDLIHEREWRMRGAMSEVGEKWGQSQTIHGPVLVIPYYEVYKTYNEEKEKYVYTKSEDFYAYVLPDELYINGEARPAHLHRGIYDLVVYEADLSLSGTFPKLKLEELGINSDYVKWENVIVATGISDNGGIQNERLNITLDTAEYELKPGVGISVLTQSGVHTEIPYQDFVNSDKKNLPFKLDLKIKGNERLYFVPVGKSTKVQLKSTWKDPSFGGQYAPDHREVQDSGFIAEWGITNLNRNYPQQWANRNYNTELSAFGVDLMIGVDQYQKSFRATHYALLVIALTFMTFFFVEVSRKVRIHPLQYILVGLALALFYSLLISITEHLGFQVAYGISAVMVVGLVGYYSRFVFKSSRFAIYIASGIAIIYGFLYATLGSQEYALLMGSLGLFIILAVVMIATRRLPMFQQTEIESN
ncbi:MAG TPA: cell envelope integrity protein CreD [Flavobacteriales bacterium]|jgi:inner membrane protein|nr:cell envelope integrity protein CreD [Flavobacteriales bacterium]